MNWPINDQVQSVLQHVYTAAGTAVAVASALGIFHGDTNAIMDAVHKVGDGVAAVIGGLAIIVPFVSGYLAVRKASPVQQAVNIVKSPDLDIVPITPKGVEIVRQAQEKSA